MVEEQNKGELHDSEDEEFDNKTDKRIKREKWLSAFFVSVLIILCLLVSGGLYILSKDYLIWSANKNKAENDLTQLQEISNKQRVAIEEELKRLDAQKEKRLNELNKINDRASQINLQIAQRNALLSSSEEEKNQLDKMKAEIINLKLQSEQLSVTIDKLRHEVSQLSSQKELSTGQCSDLSTKITNLKQELDSLQKQITERNSALAESEQLYATVLLKQQESTRLKEQISALQKEITSLVNTKLTTGDETLALQQKQANAASEVKFLDSRKTNLKSECDLLENNKVVLKREIAEFQVSQASAKENLIKIRQQITDAEALQKSATQSNAVLWKAEGKLNNDISLLKVESAKIQGEIIQLRIQHKRLVDSISELEKTMSTTQKTGSASVINDKK